MEATAVVFRVDRTGTVFALFPEITADYDGFYCSCFQHVGQHCSADFYGCIADSRRATAKEYADLFNELKQRGYSMKVCRRASRKMHERRRKLAAETCGDWRRRTFAEPIGEAMRYRDTAIR